MARGPQPAAPAFTPTPRAIVRGLCIIYARAYPFILKQKILQAKL
jgi:hypothetical protein